VHRTFVSSTDKKSLDRLASVEKLPKVGELFQYSIASDFPIEILLAQLSYLGFRNVSIKAPVSKN
jgi:hypothetical protein